MTHPHLQLRGWLRALVLALPLALAAAPFAAAALTGVVNVNTASADELSMLPGVGPSRARAIVELRQQRGGFKRIEDLLDVKGIGEASLAKLKPYLALEGKSTLAE
jgi:competence protein ComEA